MQPDQGRPKTFSGQRASQMTAELDGLIAYAKRRGVRSYLEIGARQGDTFHAVMMGLRSLQPCGLAVDLPGGLWGRPGTDALLENACADLRARGMVAKSLLINSQTAQAMERVQAFLKSQDLKAFDLALIDGDHTYQGAETDWRIYKTFARVVAFHDVVGVGERERNGAPVEVPRLWAEIRTAAPAACVEFVAEGSTMGIGLVDVAAWDAAQ